MLQKHPAWLMRWFFNLYPPYLGAGIRVETISPDFKYLKARLLLRFYNQNYVGIQFGGSIYSMTDPHYMFLLINNLGPEYIVLDKGAQIDFIKKGTTDLTAEFRIDDMLLNTIRDQTSTGEKYIFDLPVTVCDAEGVMVARLIKTIYVRKKSGYR